MLKELVAEGALYRHGKVFRWSRTRPEPQKLHQELAILAYCCLGKVQRPIVAPEDLAHVLEPVLCHLKLPPPPRSLRCVIDAQERLSLLRVQRLMRGGGLPDLGRELAQLQTFAQDKAFRPWASFAREGRFSITYLLHDVDQARELGLWTERRPLVSRVLREPVVVPLLASVIPDL